jgi:hypothetical protein
LCNLHYLLWQYPAIYQEITLEQLQAKSGITGKTTARSVLSCLAKNWIGESFRHVYSFSTSTR